VSMLPPLTDPGALMKWWSSLYSDHANLSNGITFLHLAGLIVGGGAAVTTDRQILKAWRAGGDRRRAVLDDVSAVHVFVVGGLVLTIVTGALMMLADWDTFSFRPEAVNDPVSAMAWRISSCRRSMSG